MKKIALIGATGSIGRQTLSVIDKHPEEFTLYSAAAGHGGEEFIQIVQKYRPEIAAVADKETGEKTARRSRKVRRTIAAKKKRCTRLKARTSL